MARYELSRRFYESTRGRIVLLLRRGARTVEELASDLGLTDNAVRSHLAALERDGLARQAGSRRGPGAGKPAAIYEIAPGAEPLFSRAYAPLLLALLDELAPQLDRGEGSREVMQSVGKRLAGMLGEDVRPPEGHVRAEMRAADLSQGVRAAVGVLAALGGQTDIEHESGVATIRGCGACPLGMAVARHPGLCRAIEALLGEVTGAEVRSVCVHGDRPRCGFELRAVA